MASLAEALGEAAALAQQDDRAFGSGCSTILSRLKRGCSEVRKAPELLDEQVPADAGAWSFLLRVASEKPSFAKQAWDTASVLLGSSAWASAFATLEGKHRLNLAKAGARDSPLAAGLVLRLLAVGAADVDDLLPLAGAPSLDPALCLAVLEGLASADFPAATAEAARSSEVGRALAERAAQQGTGAEEKRRVVGPGSDKKAFGKGENLPVYVCEGISGSHQKMEIKKGL